ncbi:MAG TPA: hypothetical protein VLV15_13765, partial [Dongiaceae bacterium]|nr:hypothetical protein [Dongiaceae bacterium]
MRRRWWIGGAIALLSAAVAAPLGASPARFEVHGRALTERQFETLLADPRGRSDSTAVAAGLARLVGALQDLGYLDVTARAERASADTTNPGWRVFVTEGERRRLTALRVDVGGASDSMLVANVLGLAPGGWASPRALGEAVERALDAAASRGYPYASLGVTALEWDSAGARARIGGALGPRVTVTGVRFDGLSTTSVSLVKRTAGPLEGRPYDPAAAEEAADRLRQLGLFRTVTFSGLESSGDWSKGVLVYKIEEPRYNTFEGALGLQGAAGARQVVGLARIEL